MSINAKMAPSGILPPSVAIDNTVLHGNGNGVAQSAIQKSDLGLDAGVERLKLLQRKVFSKSSCGHSRGNFEFKTDDCGVDESLMGSDDLHAVEVEVARCRVSLIFLQRLLQGPDSVPTEVVTAVLNDEVVIEKLWACAQGFSYGTKRDLPDDLEPELLHCLTEATKIFSSNLVPLVLWQLDGGDNQQSDASVDASVVYDALQIYRLVKYNRTVHIEVGRNVDLSHEQGGPLPVDILNPFILQELVDVCLDEILASVTCLQLLAQACMGLGNSEFTIYAKTILTRRDMISLLWNRFKLLDQCYHQRQDVKPETASGEYVQVERLVRLQAHVLGTICAIHFALDSFPVDLLAKYLYWIVGADNHVGVNGQGASVRNHARRLLLDGHSKQLELALYQYDTSAAVLASSFYMHADAQKLEQELINIQTQNLEPLLDRLLNSFHAGRRFDDVLALVIFSHVCLLASSDRRGREVDDDVGFQGTMATSNVVTAFVKRCQDHRDLYSSALYIACCQVATMEYFSTFGLRFHAIDNATASSFHCGLVHSKVVLNTFINMCEIYGVWKLTNLDLIFRSLELLPHQVLASFTAHVQFQLVFEQLKQLFPYSTCLLFQFIHVFMPPSSGAGLKLLVDVLCSKFTVTNTIPTSGLHIKVVPVAGEDDAYETVQEEFIQVQLLSVLGFDKEMLLERWMDWNLGRTSVLPAKLYGRVHNLDGEPKQLVENHIKVLHNTVNADISDVYLDQKVSFSASGEALFVRDFSHNKLWTIQFSLNKTLEGNQEFTVAKALWIVYKGCLAYSRHMSSALPPSLLRVFSYTIAIYSKLFSRFPNIHHLIASHLNTSLYVIGTPEGISSQSKFIVNPYSCEFIESSLEALLIALERPQLRGLLRDILDTLCALLRPSLGVSSVDAGTVSLVHVHWLFMRALTNFAHDNLFMGLKSVHYEYERTFKTYPVTRSFLLLLKQLLESCPPQEWLLHWSLLGTLALAGTSMEHESAEFVNGISCDSLRRMDRQVQEYRDTPEHEDDAARSNCVIGVQSQFLLDAFSHALKTIGSSLFDLEFTNVYERLDLIYLVLEVCARACSIFSLVSSLDMGASLEDCNHKGICRDLEALATALLQIVSESHVISQVAKLLTFQLDIAHYGRMPKTGVLVMVNPSVYCEVTSTFYTCRSWQTAVAAMKNCWTQPARLANAQQCFHVALELLRLLQVAAVPLERNSTYDTLARSLVLLFATKLTIHDQRKVLMTGRNDGGNLEDVIGHFSVKHHEFTCFQLPQTTLFHSLISHGMYKDNSLLAVEITTLYLVHAESLYQSEVIPALGFKDDCATADVMDWIPSSDILDLSFFKGQQDIVAMTHKHTIRFINYLLATFVKAGYPQKVATLQYIITSTETCVGLEMLRLGCDDIDLDSLVDFMDFVLCAHGSKEPMLVGDFVLVNLSLLALSRLCRISPQCVKSMESLIVVMEKLVAIWHKWDACNVPVTLPEIRQLGIRGSCINGSLYLNSKWLNYTTDPRDCLEQRRFAMVLIIGAIGHLLDLALVGLQSDNTGGAIQRLLQYIGSSHDFMDVLFPLTIKGLQLLSPGSCRGDTRNHGGRCGLAYGYDSKSPISTVLHLLDEMKVAPTLVFKTKVVADVYDTCDHLEVFRLCAHVLGPAEMETFQNLWDVCRDIPPRNNSAMVSLYNHLKYFLCLCPHQEYGYEQGVNLTMCILYGKIHVAYCGKSSINLAVCRVQRLVESLKLVAICESLKQVKRLVLKRLCALVEKWLDYASAGGVASLGTLSKNPCSHASVNVALQLQHTLMQPRLVLAEPQFFAALLDLANLVVVAKPPGELSGICMGSGDSNNAVEVENACCNIYSGLAAQLVRYIVDFVEAVPKLLFLGTDPDPISTFVPPRFLQVAMNALESCKASGDNQDCACDLAVAAGTWLRVNLRDGAMQLRMIRFYCKLVQGLATWATDHAAFKISNRYCILHLQLLCEALLDGIKREHEGILYRLAETPYCLGRLTAPLSLRSREQNLGLLLYCLMPYAAACALEISLAASKTLHGSINQFVLVLDSLARLPFCTSIVVTPHNRLGFSTRCDTPLSHEPKIDLYETSLVRAFKPNGTKHFRNCNWLRLTVFGCLDKMIESIIALLALPAQDATVQLVEIMDKISFIPNVYLYSFLKIFIKPLHLSSPSMLLYDKCRDMEALRNPGNCAAVIADESLEIWYPCYISDGKDAFFRCPMHELHVKIAYLVAQIFNGDIVADAADTSSCARATAARNAFKQTFLQILRVRIPQILGSKTHTLATLEEASAILQVHASGPISCKFEDIVHFANVLVSALDNGAVRIANVFVPVTKAEKENPDIFKNRLTLVAVSSARCISKIVQALVEDSSTNYLSPMVYGIWEVVNDLAKVCLRLVLTYAKSAGANLVHLELPHYRLNLYKDAKLFTPRLLREYFNLLRENYSNPHVATSIIPPVATVEALKSFTTLTLERLLTTSCFLASLRGAESSPQVAVLRHVFHGIFSCGLQWDPTCAMIKLAKSLDSLPRAESSASIDFSVPG